MVSLSFVGGMDVAHECLRSRFEVLKNNTENESNLPQQVFRMLVTIQH